MEVPVLGPMERLMTGELRQLHYEQRHNFSTSPNSSSLTAVVWFLNGCGFKSYKIRRETRNKY